MANAKVDKISCSFKVFGKFMQNEIKIIMKIKPILKTKYCSSCENMTVTKNSPLQCKVDIISCSFKVFGYFIYEVIKILMMKIKQGIKTKGMLFM
jgi:hypothetical protein